MDDYCRGCSLVVAPYDPGRMQVGRSVFHAPCLADYRRRHPREDMPPPTRRPNYRFFRGVDYALRRSPRG